jgi:predicted DNA-binding protein
MAPASKTFTFTLPEALKDGLRTVKERDGLTEAEQIRRAITMWLESRGIVNTERKRASSRRRS